ncbi:MAG: oxidoreductase [Candidatus Competibacterales bacterium]
MLGSDGIQTARRCRSSGLGRPILILWRGLLLWGLALGLWGAGPGAAAEDTSSLPPATGPVLLTVKGAIDHTNAPGVAQFDRAMLEALPQVTVTTHTPWTEGPIRFEGPLLRDILAQAGARGQRLQALALNRYRAEIPVADLQDYSVIAALTRDGQPLTVRTQGPLWIVYPWDDHPGLDSGVTRGRAVWQLYEITVQ